jgi:hypothetical protein
VSNVTTTRMRTSSRLGSSARDDAPREASTVVAGQTGGSSLTMVGTRRLSIALALLTAVVAAVACGSSTASKPPSTSTHSSAANSAASTSRTYASKAFAIPVTVTVPPPLPVMATEDVPTFLTWVYQTDDYLSAIRMMLPADVYPTAQSPQQPPPPNAAAFVAYLHTAVAAGAIITNEKQMAVGGQSATVLTLSAQPGVDLDGLFGCPNTAASAADCYGPGSDTLMQVAIVEVDNKLLLIWARADSEDTGAAAFIATFQPMLAGLKFR